MGLCLVLFLGFAADAAHFDRPTIALHTNVGPRLPVALTSRVCLCKASYLPQPGLPQEFGMVIQPLTPFTPPDSPRPSLYQVLRIGPSMISFAINLAHSM
jgi:hypothetical protein